MTEVTEEVLTSFNRTDIRKVPVPGGGGIMTAADLALFYQALITGRSFDGEQIWHPETLQSARQVRTADFNDLLTGTPVNRGLGISVAGDEKRNFREIRGSAYTTDECGAEKTAQDAQRSDPCDARSSHRAGKKSGR